MPRASAQFKMNFSYSFLPVVMIVSSLIFYASCGSDEELSAPLVTTKAIQKLSSTSIKTGGNVTGDWESIITARGVVWSDSPNPTVSLTSKTVDGSGSGSFESIVSGLLPGKTYYVRAYATNGHRTRYGNELKIEVTPELPVVLTKSISDIGGSFATVELEIRSTGGTELTEVGVVWATSTNPTTSLETRITTKKLTGIYSIALPNLESLTKYYVRAYAINSTGIAYGEELIFTTLKYSTTFSRLYDLYDAYDLLQTKDKGYLVAGQFLVKLDSVGNEMWRKERENGALNYTKIKETQDNAFIVVDGSSIQKYDASGNSIYSHRLSTTDFVTDSNGNAYVLGYFEGYATIHKFNAKGNLLWSKSPDGLHVLSSSDASMCVAGDGNIVIVSSYLETNLTMVKIDYNVNVLSTVFYDCPERMLLTKIKKCDDNSFIIATTTVGPYNDYDNWILKLDATGGKSWQTKIDLTNGSYLQSVTQTKDGGFAFAGGGYNSPYTPVKAFIVKLDSYGEVRWQRTFFPPDSDDFVWRFWSLVETADQGFAYIGFKAYVWSGTVRGAWLLKTDANGNTQPQ
jgi:hypothetical protein